MKVNVTIECTPEEARAFMGLPDLTSVHEAYLGKVREALEGGFAGGIPPDGIERFVRSLGPMGEAGLGFWQRMVDQGQQSER